MPLLNTSGTQVLILIEWGTFRVFWVAFGCSLDSSFAITYTQALKFPQYQPIKQGLGVREISLVCTCGVFLVK